MTRTWLVSAVAVVLVLIVDLAAVHAATLDFEANLNSFQEVPPNVSPAFGLLDATVDDVSGAFTVVTGSYNDLLGVSTAVTINDAAAGANGPVLFSLTLNAPGTSSGTFSGSAVLTSLQIADIVEGKLYVNIRSSVFPSGEIRGQLYSVPEPATFVLAALGLVGVALAARRNRERTA